MKDRIVYYTRILVSFVFLISAFLKAIDSATFANLMSQYGVLLLGLGAPLIIFTELIIGVLLLFNVRPRLVSWITTIFLTFISTVFLYGVIYKGINDCGCFGPLTWLNSKPWLTFLRNGILLTLLIPSLPKPQKGENLSTPIIAFFAVIGIAVMFMCGFSMHDAKCLQKQQKYFKPIPLSESKLSDLVSCSSDSTYMVFAFSYKCPYCLNSIGNVNQYQKMEYVDKVIGIAIEDADAHERFEQLFETNFTIKEVSHLTMAHMTSTLPTVYLIRHDSIINQYSGLVVSPALLLP